MKKTLYVNRPLLNGEEVIKWAKSNGFKTTLSADEMHVTIAFSKTPVEWDKFEPRKSKIRVVSGERSLKQFNEGATVLAFQSTLLHERWKAFRDGGASWDFPEYQPHVTISYKAEDLNVKSITPYSGELVFGPEEFEAINLDWKNDIKEQ